MKIPWRPETGEGNSQNGKNRKREFFGKQKRGGHMSDLKIIYKHISEIKPYANNPRQNDSAVDAVAASIQEFGFKIPIVIDAKNEIIAGHTRIKAARKLGITEIPCIIADDLTEAQIKAFRIADNRVAELSTWDSTLLTLELQELANMDFNIELTGFSEEDMTVDMQPYDINELLQELDTTTTIEKPVWVSIRTDAANIDNLEKGLKIIEKNGIRVERSYG